MNVVLVPRRSWAALDLGFALGRAWFVKLWLAWVVAALPVLALTFALRPWGLWLSMLVLWWLKPAYEQLPLYVLSRALFDDAPTFRETLRQTGRWVPRGLFANLTWRRFASSRSFTAPVTQLEGLKRRARRARLGTLQEAGNAGGWLTIVGVHFEAVLGGCLMIVGYMLLPEELSLRSDLLGSRGFLEVSELLIDFAAMSVIAPFYVAGGFSLYLHRRAQIEGWDIELVFRRLTARVTGKQDRSATIVAALAVAVLTLGMSGMPAPLRADETTPGHETAKQIVTEVLQDPDFGTKKKITDWRWKADNEEKKPESVLPTWPLLIARVAKVFLWIVAAALIVFALYRLPEWLARLPRRARAARQADMPAATLFGLDVRKESLPEDIPAAARALANRGDVRAALALLYRGALATLMARDGMRFRDGHTEGECLAEVRVVCPPPLTDFFETLTRDWQRAAYGHTLPAEAGLQAQCSAWAQHFGGAS